METDKDILHHALSIQGNSEREAIERWNRRFAWQVAADEAEGLAVRVDGELCTVVRRLP